MDGQSTGQSSGIINVMTIMRAMNIISQPMSSVVSRIDIKNILTELEKTVVKLQPDIIVLTGCSRYVVSELNNKEWCKYYHSSYSSYPNNGSAQNSRLHLVLSRYPLIRNESFGSPLIHIVQTKIAFNDLPIRYEYDDPEIQMLDMDTVTIVITTDSDRVDDQHRVDFHNIISKICSIPHTVLVIGLPPDSALHPDNDNGVSWISANDKSSNLSYTSEAWNLVEYVERSHYYRFELINIE